ncbi:unnamed protein product [Rotaria sordida]|uniref:G-protein coupled receptors family 1 profile domain-containing protein n=1 Tax=Rotaria sordida TaxID=392033 RepID=A0A814J3X8_9BILA|nr:unnamed protein product [Rotaria sordida]CAF1030865.1 unnamed protein product [Rotaria sordida]CAF1126737.1 unnamed protein product [Rotaria sordida]CAF1405728.1 unnamed protein product [Rotaria sordida]CAF3621689.1 unnamed protein product [Rotaria sordida]
MLCVTNFCQNNGKCFINDTTTISYCLCNRCFTGNQCEIERYSKNLWMYGISKENKIYYNPRNEQIILSTISIISFVSNLLSLQTFLFSKKIRITNLGIYLILFSLTGLINSIIQSVFAFLNVAYGSKKASEFNRLIQCAFIRLLVYSFNFCLYWFCLCIAVERILIEYALVSLYDSRRRSLISSILLYILIPLSNLLPILFGRKDYSYNSYDFCLLNFTPVGYTFYSIFYYINYIAAPLSFTIACIFIFKHLIEHRLNLVNDESFRSSLILILSKHYDFFLPPLVFCLLTSPYFIFDKFMNCLRADSITVSRIESVIQLLDNSALALAFLIYVYLSKIYLKEFWQTSPFGRFVIYVKERFTNVRKHQMIVVGTNQRLEVSVINTK